MHRTTASVGVWVSASETGISAVIKWVHVAQEGLHLEVVTAIQRHDSLNICRYQTVSCCPERRLHTSRQTITFQLEIVCQMCF